MVTRHGVIKKSLLENFARPRSVGLIAVNLIEGDELVEVGLTDGQSDILIFSSAGKAIRFSEKQVRPMGRSARGVRALNLKPDQSVIAMLIRKPSGEDSKVLVATENGYGKQTSFSDFPLKNRGGQGVIAIKVNGRNGRVVGAEEVADGDELMLITGGGRLVRIRTGEIPVVGRNTQGVRLIRLAEDESLVSLGKVIEADDESVEESSESGTPQSADD